MRSLWAIILLSLSAIVYGQVEQDKCLVDAIFYEAKSEPLLGKKLVYWSILNRAKDPHWKPTTPCGVIYQKYQYSYTLLSTEKLMEFKAKNVKTYNLIDKEVHSFKASWEPKRFQGVNHYLRCDIRYKVKWWVDMDFLGRVGNHCFYKGY